MSAVLLSATPAQAAPQPVPMAFMNVGDIWLADGTQTFRVTETGGTSWPKISPDRMKVAFVRAGDIFIAHIGDGPTNISSVQVTHSGDAGAPSWSPHGDYLAYRAGDVHTGTLTIVRVSTDAHEAIPGVAEAGTTALDPVLRDAHTVAWSPNGRYIAFPGGECFGIYDDCLTVLELATNRETIVAAFGGGGAEQSGFATTPNWSQDSTRLYWTQQVEDGPLRIMAHRLGTDDLWQIGKDGDSMPVALAHGRFLLVAANGWITFHTLNGRTNLIRGTQPDTRGPA